MGSVTTAHIGKTFEWRVNTTTMTRYY